MIIEEEGILRPSGPALVIKLWKFSRKESEISNDAQKLINEKSLIQYSRFYEGFTSVREERDAIYAEFVVGHSLTVRKFDPEKKKLVPSTVFSHGMAQLIIHYDIGIIEGRGTSWVAKIAVRRLEELFNTKIQRYEIPQEHIQRLIKNAALISSVKLVTTDSNPLQAISLYGKINESAEWPKLVKKQEERIIEFTRAQLVPPSGHIMSCMINRKGGILIYKRGDGIPSQDIQWLISNLL